MLDQYKRIDGWFGDLEARLYRHQVDRVTRPARFVEIGSWKGRSSVCMASAIEASGKPIEFWCVDTWRGSWEHQEMGVVRDGDLYRTFLANTRPVRDAIRPLRMTSLEAADRFPDGSLDFVFIDAAHDFDSVLADIRAWLPKVRPDGVLAGHDYGSRRRGVIRAVEAGLGGAIGVFGPCWYHAPGCPRPVPWSWRAWTKQWVWKLRRRVWPQMFRPDPAGAAGNPAAATI